MDRVSLLSFIACFVSLAVMSVVFYKSFYLYIHDDVPHLVVVLEVSPAFNPHSLSHISKYSSFKLKIPESVGVKDASPGYT